MRIRRRPQPSLHQASDPAASGTPQDAGRNQGCLERDEEEEGRLDLGGQKSGVARRLALPQDSRVSAGAGRGTGDVVVHVRCSTAGRNGHHDRDQKDSVTCTGAVGIKPEPSKVEVEEHASNGALQPVAALATGHQTLLKHEEKAISNGNSVVGGGASKKRRGPAVLLEGSRCSRVNGRGWRCSQPTLVGYSLCEHHLGKGRARSSAGGARGGPGQLGRTEHRARVVLPASSSPAAPGAVTVAAVGVVTVTAAAPTWPAPLLGHECVSAVACRSRYIE